MFCPSAQDGWSLWRPGDDEEDGDDDPQSLVSFAHWLFLETVQMSV